MPANPIHKTPTVEGPYDPQSMANAITEPVTADVGNALFAWHIDLAEDPDSDPDGDGYPDLIEDSRFPHHLVVDGVPGAANVYACEDIVSGDAIDGIDPADVDAVRAHAQAHIDDAKADGTDDMMGAAPTRGRVQGSVGSSKSASTRYPLVVKSVFERPWALHAATLKMMADVLRFRLSGGRFTEAEITERLAAARAENGDRLVEAGGAIFGSVAVIPMYGILSQRASLFADTSTSGTGLDTLRGALAEALNNPSVKAVMFDIDSPGGSVDGIPEFAAELRQLRAGSKPIVAMVNTLCASAAFWLASNMTEIVVTPSGEVGSVGVYAVHEDISAQQQAEGVKTTLISAGTYKVDGNSFEPLTDSARAYIQEQVNAFYQSFLADVAKGRKASVDAVASGYGEGRTLLAKKALAAGMVDRVDTFDATVQRLQAPNQAAAGRKAELVTSPARTAVAATRSDTSWNQRMKSGKKGRKSKWT